MISARFTYDVGRFSHRYDEFNSGRMPSHIHYLIEVRVS